MEYSLLISCIVWHDREQDGNCSVIANMHHVIEELVVRRSLRRCSEATIKQWAVAAPPPATKQTTRPAHNNNNNNNDSRENISEID
jgi:hypothetical protein